MKEKSKIILKLIIITALVANSITMFGTFLMAYFNNYQLIIYINKYKEAHIELFLMSVLTISSIIFLFNHVKEQKVIYHAI